MRSRLQGPIEVDHLRRLLVPPPIATSLLTSYAQGAVILGYSWAVRVSTRTLFRSKDAPMKPKTRTDPYSTGPFSMDELTERDRLLLLEQVKDSDTIRILESLAINESSRCLEIGAGMGSIAYWLAAKCSKGHVVVVDIDTRNLEPQRSSNLNIQEADIVTHKFPPSSFDLVHARAVLCHVPAREEVLARAYRWNSPGGWLVVEDMARLCANRSRSQSTARWLGRAARPALADQPRAGWLAHGQKRVAYPSRAR